jgi:predicted DNA-binding protein with PD1-like motif
MAGCIVRTTAEIVIQRIDSVDFKRELDDKTGYKELAVKLKQHPVLSSMDDTL